MSVLPDPRPNGWNFADIWEHHARRFPDVRVQAQGDRSFSWDEFNSRANGVARVLLDRSGAGHQDKVAQYMTNCPEYLESMFGIFKASLVPVNTNYRYNDDELVYIWDNCDAVAVIFHGSFSDRVERVRGRLPRVACWIWVDDGTLARPEFAIDYAAAAAAGSTTENVVGPRGRAGSDMYFLYTGGTTGMPKGAMWLQDDIIASIDSTAKKPLPNDVDWSTLDERVPKPGPVAIPAAPLMHGTGGFNAMFNLVLGGAVITLEGRSFDPTELLDAIGRFGVNSMSIVGDAFAKPILRALDAEPSRWDISSLRVIISSGVMWSAETKDGLLRHNPRLIMVDALGSSEALGLGSSTTTADSREQTARFRLSPNTKVFTEDGREVDPGSGERGRVALRGRTAIGYYKDEAKTATTFVVIDGVRYSIPGDWAEVDADGSVRLLGRGSQCINTGGEKVYPEEVEEVIKLHPDVIDAAVVGVPDDRFGEAITAIVEMQSGTGCDEEVIIDHVKRSLAAYKAPKRVLAVDSVGRAPNGKLDYKQLRSIAVQRLGLG